MRHALIITILSESLVIKSSISAGKFLFPSNKNPPLNFLSQIFKNVNTSFRAHEKMKHALHVVRKLKANLAVSLEIKMLQ